MNVLITGTSRGIGKALASEYLKKDSFVWGIARTNHDLQSEESKGSYNHSIIDLAKDSDIQILKEELIQKQFIVDSLWLNAAIEAHDQNEVLDPMLQRGIYDINLSGSIQLIGHLINNGLLSKDATIVAISSLFDQWPDESCPEYASSKAGLVMAMRGYKLRFAQKQYRFKVARLGPISTSINPRFDETNVNDKPWVGTPEKVAQYLIKKSRSNNFYMYYPFYVKWIYYMLGWLPDRWFAMLTSGFKR